MMALVMLLGFIALVALPSLLWLYALADAVINRFSRFSTKAVWILVLFFFPPLGTVLYFLIGRSQRRTRQPVGRVVIFSLLIMFIMMVASFFYYSRGHFSASPQSPNNYQIQI